LNKAWDNYIGPIVEKVESWLSELISKVQTWIKNKVGSMGIKMPTCDTDNGGSSGGSGSGSGGDSSTCGEIPDDDIV